MKCCVSTDVWTWTNWLTFEPDPDYSPDTGTGLLSPLSHKRWYAEFYVGKIRRIRIGRCSDAWFYGGFIHWASEPSKHLCRRYMRSTACRSSLMLNNVVAFRSQKVIVNKNFALRKEAGRSTLAASTQRTMIVNNRFRASHPVCNKWRHQPWDDGRSRFTTGVV